MEKVLLKYEETFRTDETQISIKESQQKNNEPDLAELAHLCKTMRLTISGCVNKTSRGTDF